MNEIIRYLQYKYISIFDKEGKEDIDNLRSRKQTRIDASEHDVTHRKCIRWKHRKAYKEGR